jgi:hypothetical protein
MWLFRILLHIDEIEISMDRLKKMNNITRSSAGL